MSADARSLDTVNNNFIGHGAVKADAGPLSVRRRASPLSHGGIIFCCTRATPSRRKM